MAKRNAFITLKDHKPNFNNAPTCRLINPTKSEIGRISKEILQTIVKSVAASTNVNLWRSTQSVLEWFNAIENKQNAAFICFDIVDFYPSITKKLLSEAIDFASEYVNISPSEKQIIMHAKQTLLFSSDAPWVKKDARDGLFDVTMGSYDGAESCELVVVYMLNLLKRICGDTIGLYRDDGLAISQGPPSTTERTKKQICKLFADKNLRITIEANKKVVNYLDVTLDLNTGKHYPFMKPGNVPSYVHAKSNHPPNIIKRIPENINQRLSNISSDEQVFNKAAPTYQAALDKSGYVYKLRFNPKNNRKKTRRTRKRNITWYNPPFDMRVKTNLGKKFLRIVCECFPKGHPLRPIFNRNTLKLSYSCMPNAKSTIDTHNKRLLKQINSGENITDASLCNCRKKEDCPLENQCLTRGIVYQATVTTEQGSECYVGLTDTDFKSRFANHKQSFRNEAYSNQTELSKHVWQLKKAKVDYTIKWKILDRAQSYSNATKRCKLCTLEKFYIICKRELATLNKRTELASTCRHVNKFLLKNT